MIDTNIDWAEYGKDLVDKAFKLSLHKFTIVVMAISVFVNLIFLHYVGNAFLMILVIDILIGVVFGLLYLYMEEKREEGMTDAEWLERRHRMARLAREARESRAVSLRRENERPATASDIARVREQLAQTYNDPNLTIVTRHAYELSGFSAGQVIEREALRNRTPDIDNIPPIPPPGINDSPETTPERYTLEQVMEGEGRGTPERDAAVERDSMDRVDARGGY